MLPLLTFAFTRAPGLHSDPTARQTQRAVCAKAADERPLEWTTSNQKGLATQGQGSKTGVANQGAEPDQSKGRYRSRGAQTLSPENQSAAL